MRQPAPRRASSPAPVHPRRLVALFLAASMLASLAPVAVAASVPAKYVGGNPRCDVLGEGLADLKLEDGDLANGRHGDGDLEVDLSAFDGHAFAWASATGRVEGVIVKGGPGANVYDYASPGSLGDSDLRAPGRKEVSHISFCYVPGGSGGAPASDLALDGRLAGSGAAYGETVAARPGDAVELRLTYTNTGDAAATGVTLTYVVPDGAAFAGCSDGCALDGDGGPGSVVTWSLGTVGAGASRAVTVELALDDVFPAGTTTIRTDATADSAEEAPVASNEATVQVTAAPASRLDIAVRNLDAGGDFAAAVDADPGDRIEVRLTYRNGGDAPAGDVVVTFTVPEGAAFVACTASCTVDGDGGPGTVLTWRLGTVQPGQQAELRVELRLDASFPNGETTVPLDATVDTAEEPPRGGDRATVRVTVAPASGLGLGVRVEGSGDPYGPAATAKPADGVSLQLTYRNRGTGVASDVVLTSRVPDRSELVGCSGDCAWTGAGPGSEVRWELGDVPAGGERAVHFDVELDAVFPDGLTTLRATSEADSAEEAPVASNEAVVHVHAAPDSVLVLEARDATAGGAFGAAVEAHTGHRVEARLAYANEGDADATDVTLTFTIPPRATFDACGGCAVEGDGRAGSVLRWDLGRVAAGARQEVTAALVLDGVFPNGETVLRLVASVDTAEEGTRSSNEATVTVRAAPQSVLDHDGRVGGGAYAASLGAEPSQVAELRLRYRNDGDAPATAVVLEATVPPRSKLVGCGACATEGDGGPGTLLRWSLDGTFEPGDRAEVAFEVRLDAVYPAGATVLTSRGAADTAEEPRRDSNEVQVTVTAAPASGLAAAVRDVDAGSDWAAHVESKPGRLVAYRFTYRNSGNAPAAELAVATAVPEHATFARCGDGCATSGDGPGAAVRWDLGEVQPGGERVLVFEARLDGGFPTGATVLRTGATVDTREEGRLPSNDVTVRVTAAPRLGLALAADRTEAHLGGLITYTLAFHNAGDGHARAAVLRDALPPGTAFAGCSGGCTVEGGVATWDLGTLRAGSSAERPGGTRTLTVRVVDAQVCEVCDEADLRSPDQARAAEAGPVCVRIVGDPALAKARGSASALLVLDAVVGLDLGVVPSVRVDVAGVGASVRGGEHARLDLGVAAASVLAASSSGKVDAQARRATQTSTSSVAEVSLLGGAVTATLVRAVARAEASGEAASSSSVGSVIEGLTVAGVAIEEVVPGMRIDLPAAAFGEGSYVVVYERLGGITRPGDGGALHYAADLEVNMLRVHLADRLGLSASGGLDIVVAQAIAHASYPMTPDCTAGPRGLDVSGHALVARAATAPPLLPIEVGKVVIPAAGGRERQGLLDGVVLPQGLLEARVAVSESAGFPTPERSLSSSVAEVADACVLATEAGCTVAATLLRSRSSSRADAEGLGSSAAGTVFRDLRVLGQRFEETPAPNTVVELPGLGFVVLNEQVEDPPSPGHTGLTVRAIRLVVTVPGPLLGLEVVVSEAHSDARFG